MISFSDSVENKSSKRKTNRIEEFFSDLSVAMSIPIANVNNDRSK
jgi:hypothetical protein